MIIPTTEISLVVPDWEVLSISLQLYARLELYGPSLQFELILGGALVKREMPELDGVTLAHDLVAKRVIRSLGYCNVHAWNPVSLFVDCGNEDITVGG